MVATDEPITVPRPPWCAWPPYEGRRNGATKLWHLMELGKELPIPGYQGPHQHLYPGVHTSPLRASLRPQPSRALGLGWFKAILLAASGAMTQVVTTHSTSDQDYLAVTLRGNQTLTLDVNPDGSRVTVGPAPESGYYKTALVLLAWLLAREEHDPGGGEMRLAMRHLMQALDAAQDDPGYVRPNPGQGLPTLRLIHAMGPAPALGLTGPTMSRLAAEFAADQLALLALYKGRAVGSPRAILIQDSAPSLQVGRALDVLPLRHVTPWPTISDLRSADSPALDLPAPATVPGGLRGKSRAEERGITTVRPSSTAAITTAPPPVLPPPVPPPPAAIDTHPLPLVASPGPSVVIATEPEVTAPTESDILAVTPEAPVVAVSTPPGAVPAAGGLYLNLACVPYIERGCLDPGPFLMKGPSGTGKTALAGHFMHKAAEGQGGRVTTIPGRPGAEAADLLGGFAPVPDSEGGSRLVFVNGALTRAFRDVLTFDRWNCVIFEEVPRSSQEVTNLIMEVCNTWSRADIEAAGQQVVRESPSDTYYRLEVTYTGETLVAPQEKLKFILTGNFGSRYVQASGLDEAARGRMSGGWYEVALSREEMQAILAYKLNLQTTGIIVDVIMQVAAKVHDYELSLPGKLTQTLNLRNLLAWGRKVKDYHLVVDLRSALLTAAQLTWVDMLAPEKGATVDPDIRRQLLEMVEAACSANGV